MKDSHQNNIPKHVAIIMDGNGRWAKKIGKKRAFGHENGTNSVRECIDASIKLGVKNLTLYVFSTENWNRPKLEVNALMDLLVHSLEKEKDSLIKNLYSLLITSLPFIKLLTFFETCIFSIRISLIVVPSNSV